MKRWLVLGLFYWILGFMYVGCADGAHIKRCPKDIPTLTDDIVVASLWPMSIAYGLGYISVNSELPRCENE